MHDTPHDNPTNASVAPIEPPGPTRDLAMWTHLAPLIAVVSTAGGASLIAALAVWLIWKDRSPFIDDHGRESVNFQISLLLWAVILFALGFLTCGVGWFIGGPALLIYAIFGMIMASMAAQRGKPYRYPACFRFV